MSGFLPISNELSVKIPARNAKIRAPFEKSFARRQKSVVPSKKSFARRQKSPAQEQKSPAQERKSPARRQTIGARLEKSLSLKAKILILIPSRNAVLPKKCLKLKMQYEFKSERRHPACRVRAIASERFNAAYFQREYKLAQLDCRPSLPLDAAAGRDARAPIFDFQHFLGKARKRHCVKSAWLVTTFVEI